MPARRTSRSPRASLSAALLLAALGAAAHGQTRQTLPAGLASVAGNDRTIEITISK